jgi:hypothetical protein
MIITAPLLTTELSANVLVLMLIIAEPEAAKTPA